MVIQPKKWLYKKVNHWPFNSKATSTRWITYGTFMRYWWWGTQRCSSKAAAPTNVQEEIPTKKEVKQSTSKLSDVVAIDAVGPPTRLLQPHFQWNEAFSPWPKISPMMSVRLYVVVRSSMFCCCFRYLEMPIFHCMLYVIFLNWVFSPLLK